jgi:hypothetical protein
MAKLINTAMNAIGTIAALKSLTGKAKPARPSKLNNFMAELRESGVARTNLFEVQLSAPLMMVGFAKEVLPKISLLAESTQLPGINIQTEDSVKRYGVGLQDHIAYGAGFNDITVGIIGDGRGEIYKFFYRWMHGIVKSDFDGPANVVGYNGIAPHEVEFKSDYQTTIDIITYNESNDTILQYQLFGAFPKNLPDISLSWSDSDMMKFNVSFTYNYARLVNIDQAATLTPNGIKGLSTLQKLVKIGTAVQAIASLKRPRSIQDALASTSTIKNIFN